jgi:hypothetical protein
VVVLVLESIDVDVATSVAYNAKALFIVAKSESRFESLAWRKSSAGFKVKTTTTANTAMIAITTSNSIRVKPFWFFLFFIIYHLK